MSFFWYNGLNIEFTRGQKRVDVCYVLHNCLPIKWYDTQYVSEFGTKCTPFFVFACVSEQLSLSTYNLYNRR